MCADQQFGTNFHVICEAQTLGNSINVGLTAGHFSVCAYTAGGASDRRWLKARLIKRLAYLLTWYKFCHVLIEMNYSIVTTGGYTSNALILRLRTHMSNCCFCT